MKNRLCLIFAVWLMAVSTMFAQKVVSGTVFEAETGEPVIGATVMVKEATGVGSATDINGGFTIQNVPEGAKTPGFVRDYEGTNHLDGFIFDLDAQMPDWTYQIPQREIQENKFIAAEEQND